MYVDEAWQSQKDVRRKDGNNLIPVLRCKLLIWDIKKGSLIFFRSSAAFQLTSLSCSLANKQRWKNHIWFVVSFYPKIQTTHLIDFANHHPSPISKSSASRLCFLTSSVRPSNDSLVFPPSLAIHHRSRIDDTPPNLRLRRNPHRQPQTTRSSNERREIQRQQLSSIHQQIRPASRSPSSSRPKLCAHSHRLPKS